MCRVLNVVGSIWRLAANVKSVSLANYRIFRIFEIRHLVYMFIPNIVKCNNFDKINESFLHAMFLITVVTAFCVYLSNQNDVVKTMISSKEQLKIPWCSISSINVVIKGVARMTGPS